MPLSRRTMLKLAGAGAVAGAGAPAIPAAAQQAADLSDWTAVRGLFPLSPDKVHMSAMLIASHPAPVADAIARHRDGLDADPVGYLIANDEALSAEVREAAGAHLDLHASHVALTDSTTMGVGLAYAGFPLAEGDEVLTTEEDYYVTHEALRLAADKSGATVRKVALFETAADATAEEIVSRIADAITPATRLLAITWVHSSTGLKMPVPAIAAMLAEVNADREPSERVLMGLDAVHGFGVEEIDFARLGCDFFMAGCHKWLFGPRGTGILAVSRAGLERLSPVIPSFDDGASFTRWIEGGDQVRGDNSGLRLTPGGFKAFEHRWAMTEAFELHREIGVGRVAERTHELASMLKEALAAMDSVSVRTPRAPGMSAGIVAFDVDGASPRSVVERLRDRGVVASVAPYSSRHVRLTPSIRNTEDEIERAATALREIA